MRYRQFEKLIQESPNKDCIINYIGLRLLCIFIGKDQNVKKILFTEVLIVTTESYRIFILNRTHDNEIG